VLIACAFNYEAHATEFSKLGRIPVLKARMNADLHMAEDLKNTGKGNLFVIFGEPDITLLAADGNGLRVKVNGVDVFDPTTGEVRSDGADGIACWFISSTRTTTRKAFSSGTRTFSARATRTARCRRPSRQRSARTRGRPFTATRRARSTSRNPDASR
jgi:hypothetical protein